MFNLDQAIVDWRRQMIAAGFNSAETLDELESHLRDDVEQCQSRSGSRTPEAFEVALQQMGQVAALKTEFRKVKRPIERMIMTTAPMNNLTAEFEPQWKTYLKAAVFSAPALFIWAFAAVFLFPKLEMIWRDAGFAASGVQTALRLSRLVVSHGFIVALGVIVIFALVEWRFNQWPRYRRASLGVAVFVLNTVVLLLITCMFITALLAAPALLHAR
jgi:hypothetical protein